MAFLGPFTRFQARKLDTDITRLGVTIYNPTHVHIPVSLTAQSLNTDDNQGFPFHVTINSFSRLSSVIFFAIQ